MKRNFEVVKKILCFMEMSEVKTAIGFLNETEEPKEIKEHLRILKDFDEMYHDLLKEYAKQGIKPKEEKIEI